MESAFIWVKELWEFFLFLLPTYHHHECTDVCVSITWGRFIRERKPGIFFYWEPITQIYHRAANVQTHVTDPLARRTADEKQVTTRVMLRYKIISGVKALIETDDVEASINDEALAVLARVVATSKLNDLSDQAAVGRKLTTRLRTQLDPYGVELIAAHLTDAATASILHHLGRVPVIAESEDEE